MQGRRPARRKKNGKSGAIWKKIKYIAVLIAIIAAVSTFFKISDIQVEGNVIYSTEQLISASGLKTGSMLFFAGKRAAAGRIYETLPYVDRVKIKTKAPDTLVISVEEAKAAAYIETDGNRLVINRSGKVLGYSEDPQCMRIYGVTPDSPREGRLLKLAEGEETKEKILTDLLKLLDREGMIEKTVWIDLNNMGDIRFYYDNAYTVKFGSGERLDYKLSFALSIMDKLGPGEKGTIDLSTDTEGHYIPR